MDEGCSLAHTNPIIANVKGEWPSIYVLRTANHLRLLVKDINGEPIWSADGVTLEGQLDVLEPTELGSRH